MKRVLLLVVDGCTARAMRPALDTGDLPTLSALASAGTLRDNCLSIFPSITPAATASIVTGRYPGAHGIGGMSWWNPRDRTVSYLGDDVWTVLERGPERFLRDFLVHLNGDRLRAETLFQTVERAGRRAACFNFLIFRGDVEHRVTVPALRRLLPTPGGLSVRGPSTLCLGDFVSTDRRPRRSAPEADGGVFSRFGMDDESTTELLLDLPSADALPDFTVAYFADYDFEAHDKGIDAAQAVLRRFDRRLGTVLDAWGGLDRVLAGTVVMLTADHSHSHVRADDDAAIPVDSLLESFETRTVGDGWDGAGLLVCPNMRATEIYLGDPSPQRVGQVCDALLEDERVDQVICRDSSHTTDLIRVITANRGVLEFSAAPPDSGNAWDAWGGHWQTRGDLSALDADLSPAGELRYGAYPNALERLDSGLEHPPAGRMWATAKPGYEFQLAGQSVHRSSGSHGTLHELDSVVPLLIAGAPRTLEVPDLPRIVDVVPFCCRLLGLRSGFQPGASHQKRARRGG